ncbi:MAG TPA: hypothetical protein VKS60_16980 [Stellaceae bacterium]|nr:hypothetical protein [Stellaceae bacterium]
MSEGNGHDIGAVYQLVATVAADAREFRAEMRAFQADTRREFSNVKHDIASLRQAVTEYHASVLGHGILISELEEPVRRIERHLKLPPAAA